MPFDSGTGAYIRRVTTVLDETPDGDTVNTAVAQKLDTTADDAVVDLNHHRVQGGHYPTPTVTSESQYLNKSPAGTITWKNGAPIADAALKDLSNVTAGVTADINISGNAATATSATSATTSAACSGNAATATTAAACSGNSATATTAAACSGNSATATRADTLKQGGLSAPTSGGSSTAYTVTSSPVVSALVAGNVYQFKAHTACGASPTVDFDGLGAKTLKKFSGGSKVSLAAADIPSGALVQCLYDGTDMVVSSVAGAATGSYDSGSQTVTASGLLTLAHGLGAKPRFIRTFIKCTSAHQGYSVGDEVEMPPNSMYGTTDGFSMWSDATNIYIRFASGAGFTIIRNTSAYDATTVTSTNWAFVVRAYA